MPETEYALVAPGGETTAFPNASTAGRLPARTPTAHEPISGAVLLGWSR